MKRTPGYLHLFLYYFSLLFVTSTFWVKVHFFSVLVAVWQINFIAEYMRLCSSALLYELSMQFLIPFLNVFIKYLLKKDKCCSAKVSATLQNDY